MCKQECSLQAFPASHCPLLPTTFWAADHQSCNPLRDRGLVPHFCTYKITSMTGRCFGYCRSTSTCKNANLHRTQGSSYISKSTSARTALELDSCHSDAKQGSSLHQCTRHGHGRALVPQTDKEELHDQSDCDRQRDRKGSLERN